MSASRDFGLAGSLVGSLLVLRALQSRSSSAFVVGASLLAQLLQGRRDLGVSLLLLLQSFGLGGGHSRHVTTNYQIL